MKNGILGPNDGWMIVVNDVDRSFRDTEDAAIAGAFFLKERAPQDKVQVRTMADGSLRTVQTNGTLG